MTEQIISFFQSICRFNFGDFEREEFKKFLRMGLIFCIDYRGLLDIAPFKRCYFYPPRR